MFSAKLFTILVLLSLCLCVVDTGRIKRVVGGHQVICGTMPRVASLRNATTNEHLCGATFLSSRFALTAAHCVLKGAEQYVLLLNNLCEHVPRIDVLQVIVNELYDESSRAHDIAMIRTKHELQDTSWLDHDILPKLTFGLSGECTIFGYGYSHPDVEETSDELLAGLMSIVSLDDCFSRLGQFVAPEPGSGMLCAMGTGVDACQGDSGSPLMCKGLIQGVSSYGTYGCGYPGFPTVLTSVGVHVNWIRKVINTG